METEAKLKEKLSNSPSPRSDASRRPLREEVKTNAVVGPWTLTRVALEERRRRRLWALVGEKKTEV